jgi:DNA (cytosine-5)-methyltransferase 1
MLDRDTSLETYGIREVERTWLTAWQHFVQEIDIDTLPGFPIWVDEFRPWTGPDPSLPKWKQDFVRKNNEFYEAHRPFIDEWLTMRWGPDEKTVLDFPASRRKFEWQARKEQRTAASRDLEGLAVHLRPSGIRVKPPSYLPALVAITQTSLLGPKVTGTDWRRLSPREAARLQGIPFEGFARAEVPDAAIYKQLGNAVNVGVVVHLASALFSAGEAPWSTARLDVAG